MEVKRAWARVRRSLKLSRVCRLPSERLEAVEVADALNVYLDAPNEASREALIELVPGGGGQSLVAVVDTLMALSRSDWDEVVACPRRQP